MSERPRQRLWRLIGLMSGTSADGIDAAAIAVRGRRWELLSHVHHPYSDGLRRRLFALFQPETARVDEICRLNMGIGEAFAAAALRAAEEAGLPASAFDAIGSHGQTIHHLPPDQERVRVDGCGSTLQIGEPAVIAERTGITTVAAFRPRDMAAGGHGAPLVPWADHWLFARRGKGRIVQNIGGIGNATILPSSGRLSGVRAFDTGPGNMLIDGVVRLLTGGRSEADWDGKLAQNGRVEVGLLDQWLEHPFLQKAPPKSTGREEFGAPLAERCAAQGSAQGLDAEDVVATVTQLTVESIAQAYERFVPEWGAGAIAEVIVGGGGAHNPVVLARLQERLAPAAVRPVEAYGIPSGAKEAIAFALLARQTLLGRPGNVPSATGAQQAVVLGGVWPGGAVEAARDRRGGGENGVPI